jgi:hypothetical protein
MSEADTKTTVDAVAAASDTSVDTTADVTVSAPDTAAEPTEAKASEVAPSSDGEAEAQLKVVRQRMFSHLSEHHHPLTPSCQFFVHSRVLLRRLEPAL